MRVGVTLHSNSTLDWIRDVADYQLLVNFIDVKTKRSCFGRFLLCLKAPRRRSRHNSWCGACQIFQSTRLEIVRFVRPLFLIIFFRCLVCEFHHLCWVSFRVVFLYVWSSLKRWVSQPFLQHVGNVDMTSVGDSPMIWLKTCHFGAS